MPWLLVAAGGALGACARYGVGRLVGGGLWPSATFAVNLVGGLLMGLLAGWMAARGSSEGVRLFLGVGLLGGFTTFSAFSLELVLMLERGAWGLALAYAALSVVLAVLGLLAGLALMRLVP
ncbi:CrcB family protein [Thermaurantiacus sp.]